jgi:hypothetical protein
MKILGAKGEIRALSQKEVIVFSFVSTLVRCIIALLAVLVMRSVASDGDLTLQLIGYVFSPYFFPSGFSDSKSVKSLMINYFIAILPIVTMYFIAYSQFSYWLVVLPLLSSILVTYILPISIEFNSFGYHVIQYWILNPVKLKWPQ